MFLANPLMMMRRSRHLFAHAAWGESECVAAQHIYSPLIAFSLIFQYPSPAARSENRKRPLGLNWKCMSSDRYLFTAN
jgi:hypothetical protein